MGNLLCGTRSSVRSQHSPKTQRSNVRRHTEDLESQRRNNRTSSNYASSSHFGSTVSWRSSAAGQTFQHGVPYMSNTTSIGHASSGYSGSIISCWANMAGHIFRRETTSVSGYDSHFSGNLPSTTRCNTMPDLEGSRSISGVLSWNNNSGTETDDQAMRRGLTPADASTIKHHFRYLKDELDVETLNDHLIQHGIFDEDDVNEVNAEGSRRQKVDLLIRKLLRCHESCYETFLDILDEADYSYVRLELDENAPLAELTKDEVLTLEDMYNRILMTRNTLVDQMEPKHMLDYFIMYEVMDVDEYEVILAKQTRKTQTVALVDFIAQGLLSSPDVYHVFIKSLQDDTCGKYLLGKLNQNDNGSRHVPASDREFTMTLKFTGIPESAERHIVKQMTECMLHLNQEVIQQTGCQMTAVEFGSIIIYLQACETHASEKFKELCSNGGLNRVLETLLSYPEIRKHLPETTEAEVTVRHEQIENLAMFPEHEEDMSDIKQSVREHMPYFMEELDALCFVKDLQKAKTLTLEEVNTVLHDEPVSRQDRIQRMFQILLKKGDSAIRSFIDLLIQQERTDLVQRLDPSSSSHEHSLENGDDLLTNYSIHVEVSPPAEEIDDVNGQSELDAMFESSHDHGRQYLLPEEKKNNSSPYQDTGTTSSIASSDSEHSFENGDDLCTNYSIHVEVSPPAEEIDDVNGQSELDAMFELSHDHGRQYLLHEEKKNNSILCRETRTMSSIASSEDSGYLNTASASSIPTCSTSTASSPDTIFIGNALITLKQKGAVKVTCVEAARTTVDSERRYTADSAYSGHCKAPNCNNANARLRLSMLICVF